MTTFEKHYIGKGKQVEGLEIVRVTLPVVGLEAAFFEKEGVKYLLFEIAKLKEPDKFGRTHTCYFQTKNYSGEPKDQEPEQAQKAGKKKSKKQTAETEDDLPF
ncbi:MAG TPA: hypothetical protein VFC65_07515 [Prolixibacteraceae bacterium]|nr:hypothetical protein [Prolixibacteraceae bacterium]